MAWNIDDALNELYGKGVCDLTPDGYQQAIQRLRGKNRKMARQVEGILSSILKEQVFQRRQRKWTATVGTKARLALLPENPYIEEDILSIRAVLGIPDGHVEVKEGDIFWMQVQDHVKSDMIKRVAERNAAAIWLRIHRQTAREDKVLPEGADVLLPDMWQTAVRSAQVDLATAGTLEWLQRPPSGPAPYNQNASPIDWAVGRLLERHRLPWSAAFHLTMYILTLSTHWISDMDSLQVDIDYDDDPSGDPEAFTLSVHGMDEFFTREEWDRVWKLYVEPRQEYLWEERGMKPQGRRSVEIDRLKWAMPTFRRMVKENASFVDMFKKLLSEDEDIDMDQETARRSVKDLEDLLKPEP